MTTAAPVRPRTEQALSARLFRSAAAPDGRGIATGDVPGWLAERAAAHRFTVERVPLDELAGWSFAPGTGNLVHRSGRFFSVEGMAVSAAEGPFAQWRQPVIHQPETGILGILAKEFDGVLHFLMQAKMEPGNPGPLQLSPTVQATFSNYSGAHRGARVKHLDHFLVPGRGRVLADSLQSEHGSWFFRKVNRNMLVETDEDVPPDEDFQWLTLGQIGALLRLDTVVNMDTRSVVACFPMAAPEAGALRPDTELLSWLTAERARRPLTARRVPLAETDGWERGAAAVARPDGRYFRVVGVAVEAGSREVTGWSQPLFEPAGPGVTAFLHRRIGGVPHLLVRAKAEPGFVNTVELAPTVQCTPENWAGVPAAHRPPFLDAVLAADPERIGYAALHSEEGGRFLNAVSRCLFVEADAVTAPDSPPPGFQWATVGQLNALTAHPHYLDVQARTLLACVNSGAVRL
ncbi:NDP-hexose 2,3-dehydratase family protein [Streptomyces caatingaensis]|uniref:NDP-hexose 2,3-dehydratase n=1 Tax=Streptomyces caatingaensis TaxID=1678637 RepID=A0A0K9XFL7_9ACTN|nr:NDP-hexose 2,3-dehydratase family protein [Streptomyces caatingaensis]KNB52165.1 NDP-hexose 2,3-dehydratase [Streptomyces caatingaensis]